MNRILCTTMILVGVLSLLLPAAVASSRGFGLGTEVTLDFAPSCTFAMNSMGTAVVTIDGTLEPGGDGKVTIVGSGGPSGASIPSAVGYVTGGTGNIPIRMPNMSGTYS